MLIGKKLGISTMAVAAVFAIAGTSAFADSRPSNETRSTRTEQRLRDRGVRAEGRIEVRGEAPRERTRVEAAQERTTRQQRDVRRRDAVQSRSAQSSASRERAAERSTRDRINRDRVQSGETRREATQSRGGDQWRGSDQYRDRNRGTYDRNRSGSHDRSRSGSYDRNRSQNDHYRHGSRQPYYHRGRVTKYHRYNGGYRVWIAGAPYPFYVPDWYYRRSPFRVGVVLNLGGYYNPGGYYDYYDGVYDGRGYSSGVLRGVVESVDYRRDTFVVRNEATGSFVTIAMRGYDRLYNDLRPGDYVEVTGEWRRSGLFESRRIDLLDDGYRRY